MHLIVLFNLKEGQSAADYENWAKTVDIPTVSSLKSIADFKLYKTNGLFGTDAPPPFAYVEIIEVTDPDLFGQEVATPTMGEVAAAFQSFADQPMFMICDAVA